MLGYGSIAHIGYIAVAIGLNTMASLAAAFFHITVHAAAKAMLFTAAGGLAAASGHRKDYDSLRGAARRDPLSGTAFIIGGLALVGIPPFSGFASKLYLTFAALETQFAALVIVAVVIIGTLLAAMYYFPAMACILLKPAGAQEPETTERVSLSFLHQAALIAFMALTIYLGLFSRQVIRVIEQGLAVLG